MEFKDLLRNRARASAPKQSSQRHTTRASRWLMGLALLAHGCNTPSQPRTSVEPPQVSQAQPTVATVTAADAGTSSDDAVRLRIPNIPDSPFFPHPEIPLPPDGNHGGTDYPTPPPPPSVPTPPPATLRPEPPANPAGGISTGSASGTGNLRFQLSPYTPRDIDVAKDGSIIPVTVNRRNVNVYAWNTFFALNWPAYPLTSGLRGEPNPTAVFGMQGPVVWDTFREKRELFRPIQNESSPTGYSWDTSDPGPFNDLTSDPSLNPDILPCQGQAPVLPENVYNYLDETQEIGLATIWLLDDRPNQENLVRTQVKMNRSYYEFVRYSGLYSTDSVNAAVSADIGPDNPFGSIELPSGGPHFDGAILLKTSWARADYLNYADQYYQVQGMYYEDGIPPVETPICYRVANFALIAMHIIHKTDTFPEFLFTSFENDFNQLQHFKYANSIGPASVLPNGFGHTYTHPDDPQQGLQYPPYPVQQLHPIHPTTQALNQEAKQIMAETNPNAVWRHYHLVGVQYVPTDTPFNPLNDQQDYYLANPVVETNQRFQYFTGDFDVPFNVNVQPHPYRYTQRVQMGGCMGCHGAGAQGGAYSIDAVLDGKGGTDFSFILNNVRQLPTDLGVETLQHPALQQITTGASSRWFKQP